MWHWTKLMNFKEWSLYYPSVDLWPLLHFCHYFLSFNFFCFKVLIFHKIFWLRKISSPTKSKSELLKVRSMSSTNFSSEESSLLDLPFCVGNVNKSKLNFCFYYYDKGWDSTFQSLIHRKTKRNPVWPIWPNALHQLPSERSSDSNQISCHLLTSYSA